MSRKISVDDDETATSERSGIGGGSNHNHIGTAMTGAMQKISSPIGGTLRKVVRKTNSNGTQHDDVDERTADKNPSDHSSGSNKKNSTATARGTPKSATRKKKSFGSDDAHIFGGVEKGAKEVANFFGGAGKGVKQLVTRNNKGGSSSKLSQDDENDGEDEHLDAVAVPPDDTLQKMNVIINKRLKGVSIPSYYQTVWSEDTGSLDNGKQPLFRSFLEESGKEDIVVGDWETADANDGKDVVGDWDGEQYTQKRTVTFVFDKKVPMQSKPVVAQVKQTHYCRVEGSDKCVVAMNIDMKGVPFSDCFNVEIRWVATRSGKNDLAIQVGLFVNFVKSTMLAGKIRAGTTDQTSQQQLQLFAKVQEACGAAVEEVPQDEATLTSKTEDVKPTQEEAGRLIVLSGCFLLCTYQATSLFTQKSPSSLSSSAITSVVAGLMLLLPSVCELPQEQYLFVVVAHLVQWLPSFSMLLLSSLKTLLLLASWAILAWGVWQQRAPSLNPAGEEPLMKSKVKTS